MAQTALCHASMLPVSHKLLFHTGLCSIIVVNWCMCSFNVTVLLPHTHIPSMAQWCCLTHILSFAQTVSSQAQVLSASQKMLFHACVLSMLDTVSSHVRTTVLPCQCCYLSHTLFQSQSVRLLCSRVRWEEQALFPWSIVFFVHSAVYLLCVCNVTGATWTTRAMKATWATWAARRWRGGLK